MPNGSWLGFSQNPDGTAHWLMSAAPLWAMKGIVFPDGRTQEAAGLKGDPRTTGGLTLSGSRTTVAGFDGDGNHWINNGNEDRALFGLHLVLQRHFVPAPPK